MNHDDDHDRFPLLRPPIERAVDDMIRRRCRQLDMIILLALLALGGLLALMATEIGWLP